jgi:hypothetical protein
VTAFEISREAKKKKKMTKREREREKERKRERERERERERKKEREREREKRREEKVRVSIKKDRVCIPASAVGSRSHIENPEIKQNKQKNEVELKNTAHYQLRDQAKACDRSDFANNDASHAKSTLQKY